MRNLLIAATAAFALAATPALANPPGGGMTRDVGRTLGGVMNGMSRDSEGQRMPDMRGWSDREIDQFMRGMERGLKAKNEPFTRNPENPASHRDKSRETQCGGCSAGVSDKAPGGFPK